MMKKLFFTTILLVCFITNLSAMQTALPQIKPFATNGLLIFLDDSERDNGAIEFSMLSSDLLSALVLEEAGPVVASASLIVNIHGAEKPTESNPEKLLQTLNESRVKDSEKMTEQERKEEKKIILSNVSFDANAAEKWIIKEINTSLYLLLPKKYLQSKNISDNALEASEAQNHVSATEQALGFKVNHMKTVKVTDIKAALPEPQDADYFIKALPKIFVTNSEYPKQSKNSIPAWAIYLNGHGSINDSLAHLTLEQFRTFLTFLENKIRTKLLLYESCYAAGVNTEIIYKDFEKDIYKTYPFAIITHALTDAPTKGVFIKFYIEHGKLKPKINGGYSHFLNMATSSDVINYRELVAPLLHDFKNEYGLDLSHLPQIKFPGLPWFSVIDSDKVINIGSVLAKTRTQPLDIATFFAMRGKRADPLGILLYAENIPFELIINTAEAPAIISMIPGGALHHINKISSASHTVDKMLNSFLTTWELAPRKIFIINELSGPFSEDMTKVLQDKQGTLLNLIIDLTTHENNIYFSYKEKLYHILDELKDTNSATLADAQATKKYNSLLAQYGLKKVSPNFSAIEAKAQQTFAQKMTSSQAEEHIKDLLDTMPDNSIIRIPKINGEQCPPEDIICWWTMLTNLQNYSSLYTHKIIWFDQIENCLDADYCFPNNIDVIIDTTKKVGTTIFYKDHEGKNPASMGTRSYSILTEDYVPTYEKMFNYFKKNKTLDVLLENAIENIEKRSVHELLTPENIAKLKETLIAQNALLRDKERKSLANNLFELTSTLQSLITTNS